METQTLKEHYLQSLRSMCPTMSEDKPDRAKLAILQKRTLRLIEMLTLFDRPYTDEIPVMQKAILQHLTNEGVPKKERQQIIESWGNWTEFLFQVSRHRGLLSQFLQYHHRQLDDLERLVGDEPSETPDLLTD